MGEDDREREWMSTVPFIPAAPLLPGMPFACDLLLHLQPPSTRELSLPLFVAIASSGDDKFSKFTTPGGR